jgi:hypothetical protein
MQTARCVFLAAAVLLGLAASGNAQTEVADLPATLEAPRPAALVPLYSSLGVLQGLDFDSSRRALRTGLLEEANPLLRPVAGSNAMMLAVKAGTTGAVVFASERLRKRHPKLAVGLLIGVNVAYAVVVAHNYANLRRVGR